MPPQLVHPTIHDKTRKPQERLLANELSETVRISNSYARILQLQQTIGNRGVQRLLDANKSRQISMQNLQRCACGRSGGLDKECETCKSKRLTDELSEQPSDTLQRACRNGRWRYEYDGCSLPPTVTRVLGIRDKDNPAGGSDTHFSSPNRDGACDNHDRCYQTCNLGGTLATLGLPLGGRNVCDLNMYRDMMETCNNSTESASVKASCRRWANIYYAGLAGFAGPVYLGRQLEVCRCGLF